MIKHHLKIAWRNLLKNKVFSAINIFGLAIGITCSGLILLWVEDELNYDVSIPDHEFVYYLPTNQVFDGEIHTFYSTPGPLAKDLKDAVPGIVKSSCTWSGEHMFTVGNTTINRIGRYANSDFIDIFGLQFIEGNPQSALNRPDAVVLTVDMATDLFGKSNITLGQTIKVDNEYIFTVTGVVENLPVNTTFGFDWLLPFERFLLGEEDMGWATEYGNNFADTFVRLDPNADVDAVDLAVREWIPSQMKAGTNPSKTYAFLHALEDWRLHSDFKEGKIVGGRITLVKTILFIALVILLIACINFMNLSTAKSEKRASEVGVRKVLGSSKKRLVTQFLMEALIMAGLAAMFSVFFLVLILPFFNTMVEKQLELVFFGSGLHMAVLALITLVCGLLAGWYPALYLSSFRPSYVLKGGMKKGVNASMVRKGLVICQFAVSIVFIVATMVIYQQVKHTKGRFLGYSKDNLIKMEVAGNMIKDFEAIRNELVSSGQIADAALTNSNMLSSGNNGSGFQWQGGTNTEETLIRFRHVTPDFFDTTGLAILEGRGFSNSVEADSTKVLINKSFADLMGKGTALGKTVSRGGMTYTVVGVVNDHFYGDVYGNGKSGPILFFHNPDYANEFYVRVEEGVSFSKALATMEKVMAKYNPAFPFEYRFESDLFNIRFKNEELIGKLARVFSILTMLISCLGLFGLSAYMVEQRQKEIGVRKVLGASVSGIVKQLSKDFMKLVVAAMVISIPIAWWMMNQWLERFTYRINIELFVFGIAGMTAVGIAMATISFQTIKAAMQNPVKSLRTE